MTGSTARAERPLDRLRTLWTGDPKGVSLDLLRIGMGFIWALNLIFILDPANQYFSTFSSVADSYDTQTLGGPAIPDFVVAHAAVFAWLIAVVSVYLAVALLLGFTTRLASLVGGVASVFFLWTQFLMTFMLPGGTDVGAHPLYLLIYVILFVGGAGKYLSVDRWYWEEGGRHPQFARFFLTPPIGTGTGKASDETPSSPSRDGELVPRRRFWKGSLVSLLLILLLLALAVVPLAPFSRASGTGGGGGSGVVKITDIHYSVDYANGSLSGGVGPSSQDGCFLCVEQVNPGSVAQEEVMLTNNQSSSTVVVESMTVSSPFSIVSGPAIPASIAPGFMWMFVLKLGTPTTPGTYTVDIVFQVK